MNVTRPVLRSKADRDGSWEEIGLLTDGRLILKALMLKYEAQTDLAANF